MEEIRQRKRKVREEWEKQKQIEIEAGNEPPPEPDDEAEEPDQPKLEDMINEEREKRFLNGDSQIVQSPTIFDKNDPSKLR